MRCSLFETFQNATHENQVVRRPDRRVFRSYARIHGRETGLLPQIPPNDLSSFHSRKSTAVVRVRSHFTIHFVLLTVQKPSSRLESAHEDVRIYLYSRFVIRVKTINNVLLGVPARACRVFH